MRRPRRSLPRSDTGPARDAHGEPATGVTAPNSCRTPLSTRTCDISLPARDRSSGAPTPRPTVTALRIGYAITPAPAIEALHTAPLLKCRQNVRSLRVSRGHGPKGQILRNPQPIPRTSMANAGRKLPLDTPHAPPPTSHAAPTSRRHSLGVLTFSPSNVMLTLNPLTRSPVPATAGRSRPEGFRRSGVPGQPPDRRTHHRPAVRPGLRPEAPPAPPRPHPVRGVLPRGRGGFPPFNSTVRHPTPGTADADVA